MTVYKYVMNHYDLTFYLPIGAKILSVQMQGKYPSIWALLDETKKFSDPRRFVSLETGVKFEHDPEKMSFIGTVIDSNGYVSHIFEIFP